MNAQTPSRSRTRSLTENQRNLREPKAISTLVAFRLARFRGNVFISALVSSSSGKFPFNLKTFGELGLPQRGWRSSPNRPRGLVRSRSNRGGLGKSTTLAAMIAKINKELKGPHPHGWEDPSSSPPPSSGIVNHAKWGTVPTLPGGRSK